MILCQDPEPLREALDAARARGQRIALVPTMGNLHDGHLQLVRTAAADGSLVVVSIFVNPSQFGANEDFAGYPRTREQDLALLEQQRTDLVFMPELETIYPRPPQQTTRLHLPGLSELLCGASRPGHFDGVATVVCMLFNLVRPDLALFGRKDYQQLLVIRQITRDLHLPIEIRGVDTVRAPDGLALSSRNGYLSEAERARAPRLHQTLAWLVSEVIRASDDLVALEQAAAARLREAGFIPDYVAVRRAEDLTEPREHDQHLVALAAAHLGRARLIDNLEFSR